jgi:hypothetical protein
LAQISKNVSTSTLEGAYMPTSCRRILAVWEEMPGKKDTRLYIWSPFGSVDDRDEWPAMMDWLIDGHVRFRRAIQVVGDLDA